MAITKKGWQDQLAMSLFLKEPTYDAGVTMTAGNACSMDGFEVDVDWPDRVESDKGEVTGKEHGNDQEIIGQMVSMNYSEAHAKPNSLIGLGGLVMGSVASVQDGALAAYKHTITPVTVGTALPSIQVEHKKGGIQYAYKGVKGNSLEIKAEGGGPVQLAAELMGSGTRASSATAFPASIDESWLLTKSCKVWLESGADITITAAGSLVQDAEDISSATPESIGPRLTSFTWKFMNNLEGQPGFGGAGVYQDIDYVRRAVELQFQMLFNDATELNYFINQNPLAIEFDLKGALIAATGTMYYGFQLVVPRFKLKKAPKAEGGVDDKLLVTMDCEVFDDGTNKVSIIQGYNAKSAYLA